jgi:hypothetical protein
MPRPVYSSFNADEEQKPANEEIQGYLNSV